jgi:hypothetical protein
MENPGNTSSPIRLGPGSFPPMPLMALLAFDRSLVIHASSRSGSRILGLPSPSQSGSLSQQHDTPSGSKDQLAAGKSLDGLGIFHFDHEELRRISGEGMLRHDGRQGRSSASRYWFAATSAR